jgi:hypothetical protein
MGITVTLSTCVRDGDLVRISAGKPTLLTEGFHCFFRILQANDV